MTNKHSTGTTICKDAPNNRAAVRSLPQPASEETSKLLGSLLREAMDGEVVGAVVIPMYRRGSSAKPYSLQLAGLASANPTLAAGAMSACQVLVQELALQDAGLL